MSLCIVHGHLLYEIDYIIMNDTSLSIIHLFIYLSTNDLYFSVICHFEAVIWYFNFFFFPTDVTPVGIVEMNESRMPAVFLGHGSPMNALENNSFTDMWRELAKTLPRPKGIVLISAHWYIERTAVTAMEKPRTIHDFGGFPQALFDCQYPASGSPQLAKKVVELLAPLPVALDHKWGLDHGAWCVLTKMYPEADIPVVQISIDGTKPPLYHFELGKKLNALRDEGILILASGNVVHNLRTLKWNGDDEPYPWAEAFNQFVRENLSWQGEAANHPLVNYMKAEGSKQSFSTPEHYLPILYALGCRQGDEPVTILTDGILMGSLSMLSIQIGNTPSS